MATPPTWRIRSPRAFLLAGAGITSLALHAGLAVALHHEKGSDDAIVSVDPAPAFVGDSFDVGASVAADPGATTAAASESPSANDAPPADGTADEPSAKALKPSKGAGAHKKAAVDSPTGGPGEGEASRTDGLFGATGERGAADLATAFTRGFAQIASADPSWAGAPIGAAGDVVLTITIDATGRIVSTDSMWRATTPLTRGIDRTMALLRPRQFTAKGATTRLHLVATVSTDQIHDGLHGDVFALGGSFYNGAGDAFFALSIGRRIDLHVSVK